MNWLRSLTSRDLRAFIALWASIGGTMALTSLLIWIIWILWLGGWPVSTAETRVEKIALIAILVAIIMGVTMTSLGMAINRRTLKANIGSSGFEASGGDEVPAVTTTTTTSTVATPSAPLPEEKP